MAASLRELYGEIIEENKIRRMTYNSAYLVLCAHCGLRRGAHCDGQCTRGHPTLKFKPEIDFEKHLNVAIAYLRIHGVEVYTERNPHWNELIYGPLTEGTRAVLHSKCHV